MSNQPAQTRPWYRLLSISRSPLQEPSPTPKQATFRPIISRAVPAAESGVSSVPTFPVGRASQPSSPADKRTITANAMASTTYPLKTTTSSLSSSPAKRDLTTTSVTSSLTQKPASPVATTTNMPSPKASSTTTVRSAIHNQIQSPQTKPAARPPSQSKCQNEAESHTMLVQKSIDNPKGWQIDASQKDLDAAKEKGRGEKSSSDFEDAGGRIITITSNNQLALTKTVQYSPHKNVFQGSPHRLQKNANSEAAGEHMMKGESNSSNIMPTNAFINSNVQGINNSIVYNSSCTEHNPGVHLTLYS